MAGHAHNAMFNLASTLTKQDIHLVGILTEAVHTPFIADRIQSLENTNYVFNAFKDSQDALALGGELVTTRQQELLVKVSDTLTAIAEGGLLDAISQGVFGDIKRPSDKGKGADGVITKSSNYQELFIEPIVSEESQDATP
jgi:beta-lysine 5,6-aminomutase alpha subunit